MRLMPPLVVSDEEVRRFADALRAALKDTTAAAEAA
jgi:4-aminobutyrate aminotransferase-like enzyme